MPGVAIWVRSQIWLGCLAFPACSLSALTRPPASLGPVSQVPLNLVPPARACLLQGVASSQQRPHPLHPHSLTEQEPSRLRPCMVMVCMENAGVRLRALRCDTCQLWHANSSASACCLCVFDCGVLLCSDQLLCTEGCCASGSKEEGQAWTGSVVRRMYSNRGCPCLVVSCASSCIAAMIVCKPEEGASNPEAAVPLL